MPRKFRKRPIQQELQFSRRGGRRPGAGRKKSTRVSHAARPKFTKPVPAHVTLGVVDDAWNLGNHRSWKRISQCLQAARDRHGMRLIEFSVLGDHLHFVVEADSSEACWASPSGSPARSTR